MTGGNMDSLINRYTADLRLRSEDAYTPDAKPGARPSITVGMNIITEKLNKNKLMPMMETTCSANSKAASLTLV